MFGAPNALSVSRYGVVSIDLRAGHMSCKDTIHLICWYLEGRLSSSVEVEIKRHLQSCPDCHMVLVAAISTLDHYFASEGISAAGASTQAA
jgi:hypothetical protein